MRAPDFWRRRGLIARFLAPLGVFYGLIVKLKTRRGWDAGVPVICVGNLTAGGSGKTPIAIAIAELVRSLGKKPFFLTRGYGGSEHGPVLALRGHDAGLMGDEALLLARHAQTVVSRDRAAGALFAVAKGADVIVMDDGHQNFSLRKDLSLVVVDAEAGFGNGFQMPAGPLREPVAQGLARADAVILVGAGNPDLQGFTGPVLRARLDADSTMFRNKTVFAFAGIGRPEKLVASLEAGGARLTGSCFFADHHVYTDDEIIQLKAVAGDALLVTTEKDFVRMTVAQREGVHMLKVKAAFDDPTAVTGLLDSLPASV